MTEERVHHQEGHYNSPAHESLRAVTRCLMVYHGEAAARARAAELLAFMRVSFGSQLSPDGAYYCRKLLEKSLPRAADLAS